MKPTDDLKLDLLGCIKYANKQIRELPRRKIIMFAFSLALTTGIIYFYISNNQTILLIFAFSFAVFLYNVLYFCYMRITECINKHKKKTTR